jgi:hypothetical protein
LPVRGRRGQIPKGGTYPRRRIDEGGAVLSLRNSHTFDLGDEEWQEYEDVDGPETWDADAFAVAANDGADWVAADEFACPADARPDDRRRAVVPVPVLIAGILLVLAYAAISTALRDAPAGVARVTEPRKPATSGMEAQADRASDHARRRSKHRRGSARAHRPGAARPRVRSRRPAPTRRQSVAAPPVRLPALRRTPLRSSAFTGRAAPSRRQPEFGFER